MTGKQKPRRGAPASVATVTRNVWSGEVAWPVAAVGYPALAAAALLLAGFGGPIGVAAAGLLLAAVVMLLVSWSASPTGSPPSRATAVDGAEVTVGNAEEQQADPIVKRAIDPSG